MLQSSDHRIFLDEKTIVWLGGGKKPLEISLPKFLRVVTIEDPPFVYTVQVWDLGQCAGLGRLTVADVEVVSMLGFLIDLVDNFCEL